MTEQELYRLLQRYAYLCHQLSGITDRIVALEYKITTSYGNTGGGSASGNHSKVEDFVAKKVKLQREADRINAKVQMVNKALSCPLLTFYEKEILGWIITGRKLADYAELEGIYSSRVYKLRDKALKKAVNYIMQDKTG